MQVWETPTGLVSFWFLPQLVPIIALLGPNSCYPCGQTDLSGRHGDFLQLLVRQLSLCGALMFNWDRVLDNLRSWCCGATGNMIRQEPRSIFTFQADCQLKIHYVCVLSLNRITWGIFIQWIIFSPVTRHKCSVSELQHAVSLKTEVRQTVKHVHQKSMKCNIFCIMIWRNMCNPRKICFRKRRKTLAAMLSVPCLLWEEWVQWVRPSSHQTPAWLQGSGGTLAEVDPHTLPPLGRQWQGEGVEKCPICLWNTSA